MADKINERKKALDNLFGEGRPAEAPVTKKFTLDVESPEEVPADVPAPGQQTVPAAAGRRSRRKAGSQENGRKSGRVASIAYLEEDVYWKLKAISVASGVSISELTSQALQKSIARYEKENGTVDVTEFRDKPRGGRQLF